MALTGNFVPATTARSAVYWWNEVEVEVGCFDIGRRMCSCSEIRLNMLVVLCDGAQIACIVMLVVLCVGGVVCWWCCVLVVLCVGGVVVSALLVYLMFGVVCRRASVHESQASVQGAQRPPSKRASSRYVSVSNAHNNSPAVVFSSPALCPLLLLLF